MFRPSDGRICWVVASVTGVCAYAACEQGVWRLKSVAILGYKDLDGDIDVLREGKLSRVEIHRCKTVTPRSYIRANTLICISFRNKISPAYSQLSNLLQATSCTTRNTVLLYVDVPAEGPNQIRWNALARDVKLTCYSPEARYNVTIDLHIHKTSNP